jgi:hypothetical protein
MSVKGLVKYKGYRGIKGKGLKNKRKKVRNELNQKRNAELRKKIEKARLAKDPYKDFDASEW